MGQNPKALAGEKVAMWRVLGMADATGTDLVRAYEEGRLSQEDWAETVTRCRGCQWAEGCDAWLDAADGSERPVPQACPNAARFDALKEA